MEKVLTGVARLGMGVAGVSFIGGNCLYNVEGGHRAIVYNRFVGIRERCVTAVMDTSPACFPRRARR